MHKMESKSHLSIRAARMIHKKSSSGSILSRGGRSLSISGRKSFMTPLKLNNSQNMQEGINGFLVRYVLISQNNILDSNLSMSKN